MQFLNLIVFVYNFNKMTESSILIVFLLIRQYWIFLLKMIIFIILF